MNNVPTDAMMLRQARLSAGLTVREVAAASGLSEDSIRDAERRGVKNVRISRVIRLCKALRLDIDALAVAS